MSSVSKVSMVSACYNKESYIGEFLDSVYGQKWPELELILVNDGSTDGTREIIGIWESKLKRRGYEVKILDQENRGVSEALRTGLGHVTGDYVCFPDCDDILAPEYVSDMAVVLDEHPEAGRVICDFKHSWFPESKKGASRSCSPGLSAYAYDLICCYLFSRVTAGLWLNMVRAGAVPHISRALDGGFRYSQEPANMSLARLNTIHLAKPLYLYRTNTENSINKDITSSYNKYGLFFKEYYSYIDNTLKLLPLPEQDIKKYLALSGIGLLFRLIGFSPPEPEEKKLRCRLSELIRSRPELDFIHPGRSLEGANIHVLKRAVSNYYIGYKNPFAQSKVGFRPTGRVIGYGAYGKAAGYLMTELSNTPLKPTLLWDRACGAPESFDIPVFKPDIGSLAPEDTVLVLVKDPLAAEEIYDLLACAQTNNILYYYDILDYLAYYYYPFG